MPSMTLKNIPEELLERIRARAHAHRRSVNGEVLHLIEAAVLPQGVEPEAMLEKIRKARRTLRVPALTDKFLKAAKAEGRP